MRTIIVSAAAAAFVLAAGVATANAECAAVPGAGSAGVSKDGSLAPLEQPGASADATSAPAEANGQSADAQGSGIQKDGSNMPMGTDPSIATSPQDVQSQQHGGTTAAAGGGSNTSAGC